MYSPKRSIFFSFWKTFFIHVFFDELIIYRTLLSSFRFWNRLLIPFDKKNCVFTDKNLIIFSNNPTSFFCNLLSPNVSQFYLNTYLWTFGYCCDLQIKKSFFHLRFWLTNPIIGHSWFSGISTLSVYAVDLHKSLINVHFACLWWFYF